MLVKLAFVIAFVMQRLKKISEKKNFGHDQQRWEGGGDNF